MAEKETFFLIYSRMEYAFQTKTRLSDLSLMAQRAQLLYKLLYLRFPVTPFLCFYVSVIQRIAVKYLTLITGAVVTACVVFSIYHTEGQSLLSLTVKRSNAYLITVSKSGRTPLELEALL